MSVVNVTKRCYLFINWRILDEHMNLFIKFLGGTLPAGEIAFLRGFLGCVLVLLFKYIRHISFTHEDRKLLFLRGLFGGLAMVCNIIAFIHLKMSDAAILFQTTGFFVFIFSVTILKERVPKGAGKWLLVMLLAVVVLVDPFSYSSYNWYAFVALLGAALSAAAFTTIRNISKHGKHSSFEIMTYFMAGSMISGVLVVDQAVMPTGHEWWIILALGVITVSAQFFITGAFVTTNAVVAQFLQYVGVFINAIYGYIFFEESLSYSTVIAGIILFVASVMLALLKEQDQPIIEEIIVETKR